MDFFKWISAFIGHLGLWCVIFNHVHATALPRSTRKASEKLVIMAVILPAMWVLTILVMRRSLLFDALSGFPITYYYAYGCVLLGCFFSLRWFKRKLTSKLPAAVESVSKEVINVGRESNEPLMHGQFPKLLGAIPFNEALTFAKQKMTIRLDVPSNLDGLKLCQLSDLHFTGHVDIKYFQRIIEEANRFEPDLILITGDLVDEAPCLDWIPDTFGRLKAKHGVFYVLGNHDRRIKDEDDLRSRLAKAGMTAAAGNWQTVKHEGTDIQITGNELPWYTTANDLPDPPFDQPGLRILLSHSPDQLDWAQGRGFDLMLAGHTHGGQIQLPIIGPIVAPSRYGVLYASGTFVFDQMIMHVSRGISGDEPIRIGSRPELGLFTIRSSHT